MSNTTTVLNTTPPYIAVHTHQYRISTRQYKMPLVINSTIALEASSCTTITYNTISEKPVWHSWILLLIWPECHYVAPRLTKTRADNLRAFSWIHDNSVCASYIRLIIRYSFDGLYYLRCIRNSMSASMFYKYIKDRLETHCVYIISRQLN